CSCTTARGKRRQDPVRGQLQNVSWSARNTATNDGEDDEGAAARLRVLREAHRGLRARRAQEGKGHEHEIVRGSTYSGADARDRAVPAHDDQDALTPKEPYANRA